MQNTIGMPNVGTNSLVTPDIKAARPISLRRLAMPLLGLAGMGISGYLTYIHYQQTAAICLPNMSCSTVLTSEYAQIWGVPLALLGLLLYAAITAAGLGVLLTREKPREFLSLASYAFSLSGILFIVYLYYLEIFEIEAFCTWCVASSIVMLGIFCLAIWNLADLGMPLKGMPRLLLRWVSRYVQW